MGNGPNIEAKLTMMASKIKSLQLLFVNPGQLRCNSVGDAFPCKQNPKWRSHNQKLDETEVKQIRFPD